VNVEAGSFLFARCLQAERIFDVAQVVAVASVGSVASSQLLTESFGFGLDHI
jgi:hypothetical protein